MNVQVNRTNLRLNPDYKKVIPRFFNTGDDRALTLIERVCRLNDEHASQLLHQVTEEFAGRYKNIHSIFRRHFDQIAGLLKDRHPFNLSEEKKLLIGSYFTMEYAIEAAALFNPSVVEDPDQSDAGPGEANVVVSFRATGESHISSLIFKRGTLDRQANIRIRPEGKFLVTGTVNQVKNDDKSDIDALLTQLMLPEDIRPNILNNLHEPFSYPDVERALKTALWPVKSELYKDKIRYEILRTVNTTYELDFPADSTLSERVIFPVTYTEKNGIEDARFVKFTHDDGGVSYVATYTAYDGAYILPHLIETTDFRHFKMSPLHGRSAVNKNLALFPRKIDGNYVMISRIDGVNNYIMFSHDLYIWEDAELWQEPEFPWEYVQIGNGGSPIETEQGWLLISHGVGPMRKYCLGASLFDLKDPRKMIGRLKEPILMPIEDERHGYVPNVVYSCGSLIHHDKLFIPYAVSDQATSFATISLPDLMQRLLASGN